MGISLIFFMDSLQKRCENGGAGGREEGAGGRGAGESSPYLRIANMHVVMSFFFLSSAETKWTE